MLRVLVTGASGFVGRHTVRAISDVCGEGVEIISLARTADEGADGALDVTDRGAVHEALRRHRPTHVVNLAGIAAPSAAADNPRASWAVHLDGTLHLADAILAAVPECWLLHVGSGLVYGASGRSGRPLTEDTVLDPMDIYGVTKAAGDLALGVYARRGLKCARFRPFNHTGPGQTVDFVVPAFAMQIARIEAGLNEPVVHVGNLDAARDYLDVRDVAHAYALAVERSGTLAPGAILNVASGVPVPTRDILAKLIASSGIAIEVRLDPKRMRPSDVPVICGDSSRLRHDLDWTPRYGTTEMLSAVLDDCRQRVRSGRS